MYYSHEKKQYDNIQYTGKKDTLEYTNYYMSIYGK